MPYNLNALTPSLIKQLSLQELENLCADIRKQIISVMSVNGGHLASNLGSIEQTIAIHYVFDSPNDPILFDIGHQAYTHKIITSRGSKFPTVRKNNGLCGFTDPKESKHDIFHGGHAGACLSQSLGLAKSRDLQNMPNHIVSILGDAAFTCGLTFEALNNIPKGLERFCVILNDNEMAISKNVGAITQILSRMLNNPTSNKIYNDIKKTLEKIPGCGSFLTKHGHNIKESLKNLVSPAPFFEQFGLSYIGPIDGHDIKKLIGTFQEVKNGKSTCLIHLMTQKGRGMETALLNPTAYHGVIPFDKLTGKFHPKNTTKQTFPKIFGKQVLKMANEDASIVVVSPAMPKGSCIEEFMEIHPSRCIDVGIAEGHSITYAAGIAKDAKQKVICVIYATFLQRALDNVFHDVCLQDIPLVIAIDRGGIAGGDGASLNGIYDIGFLNAMPNMIIAQPRNGNVLKELMQSAFDWKKPTAIRYPNITTSENNRPLQKRSPGCGELLFNGTDIAIIALGVMCEIATDVKTKLEAYGINITIIDPVFVKPLDETLFSSIFATHKLIFTLEEHALSSGFGSIINSFILQNNFQSCHVVNLGIPDDFVPHGNRNTLLANLDLEPEKIAEFILEKVEALDMLEHPLQV